MIISDPNAIHVTQITLMSLVFDCYIVSSREDTRPSMLESCEKKKPKKVIKRVVEGELEERLFPIPILNKFSTLNKENVPFQMINKQLKTISNKTYVPNKNNKLEV